MSKHDAHLDHPPFDENKAEELVALLNQSLADTLDLAYQTKQVRFVDTVHMFDRDRPPAVRL